MMKAGLCLAAVVAFGVAGVSCWGRNLIRNPGFEVGSEGYGLLRGAPLEGGAGDLAFLPLVVDTTERHGGSASLRIDNPRSGAAKLIIKEVEVEGGKKYTFSLWMRASAPSVSVAVDIRGREGALPHAGAARTFNLTTEWARYSLPLAVPEGYSHFYIEAHLNTSHNGAVCAVPCSIWLDDLQFDADGEAPHTSPRLEIGTERILPRLYTLSCGEKYPARFRVRNNTAESMAITIRYKIVDEYYESPVKEGEEVVTVGCNATTEKVMEDVSPGKRGKFILTADAVGADGAVLDTSTFEFAVVDSVAGTSLVEGFVVGFNDSGARATSIGVGWQDRQIWKWEELRAESREPGRDGAVTGTRWRSCGG